MISINQTARAVYRVLANIVGKHALYNFEDNCDLFGCHLEFLKTLKNIQDGYLL